MGRFSRILGNSAYGRRVFPIMLALLACLIWASAAHAQDAPFNSQYDPPPTSTPECDYSSSDPGDNDDGTDDDGDDGDDGIPASGCEPPPVSDAEDPIVILPTTGGSFLAPVFLGLAAVVGTGVVAVRKKR